MPSHRFQILLVLGVTLAVIGVAASLSLWRARRVQHYTDAPSTSIDASCVYDQTVFTSANRVVMYYAPWCPHCTTFRPDFDKAASDAKSQGLDVCFVTVNSDSQPKGSKCLALKGATVFPTIQLEKGTNPAPPFTLYNGLRNTADLLSWVKASL